MSERSASFARSLRSRIDAALAQQGKDRHATTWFWVKAGILTGAVVGTWLGLVRSEGNGSFLFALLHGCAAAVLVFNVGHDGAHRSPSRHRGLNAILASTLTLVGMTPIAWHLKHNLAHHRFPNVEGLDPDLELGPLLRLSPRQKHRPWHRAQAWYAPLLYALSGLAIPWVLDVAWFWSAPLRTRLRRVPSRLEVSAFIAGKLVYVALEWALPLLLAKEPGQMLFALLVAQLFIGLLCAAALLPSHLNAHARFPDPEVPDRDVARLQVEATLDFAADSRLAHTLLGGFNANALHHLFPDICHVHLRRLTPLLVEEARRFGVKYHATTFIGSLVSHWALLAQLSRPSRDTRGGEA